MNIGKIIINRKIELVVASLLFFGVFSFTFLTNQRLNHEVIVKFNDVWFQADTHRVYKNITTKQNTRSSVHPIYKLYSTPIVSIIKNTGASKKTAVSIYIAATSAFWLLAIFAIFRMLKFALFDSILLSLLAFFSSASLFWNIVPETYTLGSLSMLTAFALLAYDKDRRVKKVWYTLVSSFSLSITVTNYMAGIFSSLLSFKLRDGFHILKDSLLIVIFLSVIQKALYPSTNFFLYVSNETRFFMHNSAGGFFEKIQVFFIHSFIMPVINLGENIKQSEWQAMSVQFSGIGSANDYAMILVVLWVIVILLGSYALYRSTCGSRIKKMLLLLITGQLFLHLVYGNSTFIHSLNWIPFLIIVAGFSLNSRHKWAVRITFTILLIGIMFNNMYQLNWAIDFIQSKK